MSALPPKGTTNQKQKSTSKAKMDLKSFKMDTPHLPKKSMLCFKGVFPKTCLCTAAKYSVTGEQVLGGQAGEEMIMLYIFAYLQDCCKNKVSNCFP